MRTTLRAPGQFARERGLELALRPVLTALIALLAMLIAWQVIGLRGVPLVLFELGAIGAMVSADRLCSDQADRWLRGAEGEKAVGPTSPVSRNGITILPARMLQHYFSRRRPVLDMAEAAEVHTRLVMALPG